MQKLVLEAKTFVGNLQAYRAFLLPFKDQVRQLLEETVNIINVGAQQGAELIA